MSVIYQDKLIADLLEQFKDKPNIEALCLVVAKQLQDVSNFFYQLETERCLDAAVGTQLDGIGEIVDMSRDEALKLAATSEVSYISEDETYRAFLKYKIFENTAQCNYADILKSIDMLWGGETWYEEEWEHPATIILNFNRFTGKNNGVLLKVPIIKPAGVKIMFRSHVDTEARAYIGVSMVQARYQGFTSEYVPTLAMILADENGAMLSDENKAVIYRGDI